MKTRIQIGGASVSDRHSIAAIAKSFGGAEAGIGEVYGEMYFDFPIVSNPSTHPPGSDAAAHAIFCGFKAVRIAKAEVDDATPAAEIAWAGLELDWTLACSAALYEFNARHGR